MGKSLSIQFIGNFLITSIKLLLNSFLNLTSLQILDLKSNSIDFLKENTFYGLEKLSDLNLLNNSIKRIESNAFNGLLSITSLNLSKQLLREIWFKYYSLVIYFNLMQY